MSNIHPQIYLLIYYHIILLIVLGTIYKLNTENYNGSKKRTGAFIFALFILFVIGFRPYNIKGVGTYFGDTINYYNTFKAMASGNKLIRYNDIGFDYFTMMASQTVSGQTYFFFLASLYVLPLYYACKRISLNYTFLLFLMVVTSFLFWANGVNGIRTGIGTSFLLLGFTYKDKKWIMLILFALAITFHKSMLLPIIAFFLAFFYTNKKVYFFIWITSIVLSVLGGSFWERFFSSFNVGDERYSKYLLTKADANVFASTGMRLDYLIYSSIPIALGTYFFYKKRYQSEFYIQLFNTYLLANSFWILVIRSNFSNRFASLSWIIIPFIIILPLLEVNIWKNQMAKISLILLFSFAFTYYMTFNQLWR